MNVYALLLQIPGVDAPALTWQEQLSTNWEATGWMRWPLAFCLALGVVVIIFKFISLTAKSSKTKKILKEVDELLVQQRIKEALELTRDTDSPAAKILNAGLERHDEGTERVMKAIENQGLIEMSKLESWLVVLATLTNIAPLLGFLGTVIGMILAFQSIEAAGEVEATLVNYFVAKIDGLVIDMEESAQKMVDTLHAIETGRSS
jgi:biopolymer transport protein ExbB